MAHFADGDKNDAGAHYRLGTALLKLGRAAEGACERELCGRIRANQRAQTSKPLSERQ